MHQSPPSVAFFPYTTLFRSEALVAIFLANPGNTLGWDLTAPISTWQGVEVNENGRVTRLDLGFRNISVLPETTGNLTEDRKSTRLNSSHVKISYAVFCLKQK